MSEWLPYVSLALGSGVGIAGLKVFFSLGKKEAQLDARAEKLADLEEKVDDHEALGELVRTVERDVTQLKEAFGAQAMARQNEHHADNREREAAARDEERLKARIDLLEKDVKRIGRAFSSQFPRVQMASSPDLSDHDKEK